MCNQGDPVQEVAGFKSDNECALLPLFNGMRLIPSDGAPPHYFQRSLSLSRLPCAVWGRGDRHQEPHYGFTAVIVGFPLSGNRKHTPFML